MPRDRASGVRTARSSADAVVAFGAVAMVGFGAFFALFGASLAMDGEACGKILAGVGMAQLFVAVGAVVIVEGLRP